MIERNGNNQPVDSTPEYVEIPLHCIRDYRTIVVRTDGTQLIVENLIHTIVRLRNELKLFSKKADNSIVDVKKIRGKIESEISFCHAEIIKHSIRSY